MAVIFTISSLVCNGALVSKRDLLGLWGTQVIPSDLKIVPADYRRQLLQEWPEVEFFVPFGQLLLTWGLYDREWGASVGKGFLHADQQTVSIDAPHTGFVLWHRSIIPSSYRLYLYADYKGEILEVGTRTDEKKLQEFFQR